MYLSLISNATMGSLHYSVEAKDKNGLRWHHRLIIFHAHPVLAFRSITHERSIVTVLFMDEIFHLNQAFYVHIKSR